MMTLKIDRVPVLSLGQMVSILSHLPYYIFFILCSKKEMNPLPLALLCMSQATSFSLGPIIFSTSLLLCFRQPLFFLFSLKTDGSILFIFSSSFPSSSILRTLCLSSFPYNISFILFNNFQSVSNSLIVSLCNQIQ